MNGQTLAERIREIRNRIGLTQEELASQAGITGGYLAQIETGKRSPNRQTLIALCRVLNLEKSEEDMLLAVYEQSQRERLQNRAKNREKALLDVAEQAGDFTSQTVEKSRSTADRDDTEQRRAGIRETAEEVEVILDGRVVSAAGYYINRDLGRVRQGLLSLAEDTTPNGDTAGLPSVCLVGLGRCGTNIAVRVSTLAYEAKKKIIAVAGSSGKDNSKKKPSEALKKLGEWLFQRYRDVKSPVYLVEPIVLIADLDVDIVGRIKASGYKAILEANDSKLKPLDLSNVNQGGAGNVPFVGQYLAKIILNGDSVSFTKDPKWGNYHAYLIDSAGFKENPSRVFFYIFGAGGGTGSGMSLEFALAQQYSYHHRVQNTPPQVKAKEPEAGPTSAGFEPVFSAGIAMLPHFNPKGGENAQAIHANAGRLICKYLSAEWRFSRANLSQRAESGLERLLRPWNALMLISNNIMRYIEETEEGKKVDVAKMEENANQYVAQQIFNILTAQALADDYDEQYFIKAGIDRRNTTRIDPMDLCMSLTGPVAIAYAESVIPAKEGSTLDINEVFYRSISLPRLNDETHAVEGISILPQNPDQYAETLRRYRDDKSALSTVKFFAKCSATVTIISMPKGVKLPNIELDNLKVTQDRVFPHTRVKRYALVEGTSSYLSLTTLIARSACLSDEVMTLLFTYIKRCFAKEKYKYSDEVEGVLTSCLVERKLDDISLREVLKESEDPSEIMEANWEEVKSVHERKYRDFLPDPKSFVAMDDVRLKIEDVINALKYIAATLRHQSVPLTSVDVTSLEVKG